MGIDILVPRACRFLGHVVLKRGASLVRVEWLWGREWGIDSLLSRKKAWLPRLPPFAQPTYVSQKRSPLSVFSY